VKRFVVGEAGRTPLPAIDLDGVVVIGSAPTARVRLPAQVAREAHVRIDGDAWVAIAAVRVDGSDRAAGDGGTIGTGIELAFGDYRVHIAAAPAGTAASSPQRTESLARELVRGLLGSSAAPVLELIAGPGRGARRELPPPDSAIVVGRGDEATWAILDEDLSREHAEIRRGWDGVTIRDLESKNGTSVDGAPITEAYALHDGARITLGNCTIVYRDPAERHLRGGTAVEAIAVPAPPPPRRSPMPLIVAAAVACLAAAALVWILTS
jgi:hypothetical protein